MSQITDKIIGELELGPPALGAALDNVTAPLGLPKNAATGRGYTGINIVILWNACIEGGFSTQK